MSSVIVSMNFWKKQKQNDLLSVCLHTFKFRKGESGASLWGGACGGASPGLGSCRQISKISAFVGKSRIAGVIKEASIFMPILPTVSQLRELLLFHNIEYTVHSFS